MASARTTPLHSLLVFIYRDIYTCFLKELRRHRQPIDCSKIARVAGITVDIIIYLEVWILFKSKVLDEVKRIYSQGGNIIKHLREIEQSQHNSTESILISYDFQAGSYVKAYKKNSKIYHRMIDQFVAELKALGGFRSIMEAGIGEGTTFRYIIHNLSTTISHANCYGFDISWSRLKVAKDFLQANSIVGQHLFVAELSSIPLKDNSIDIVYTSHSIEPNGGKERPILEELYRVTKNYLVLFEPDYELADDAGKKRMEEHGYVKDLAGVAKSLGYNVIKHKLLGYSVNPLNPTSVIVINKQKSDISVSDDNPFRCPITKTDLINCGEIFFSPQAYLMYPVIQGLPCLLDSQAILGCRYDIHVLG